MRMTLLLLFSIVGVYARSPHIVVGSSEVYTTINEIMPDIVSINNTYSSSNDSLFIMVKSGTVLSRTTIDSCGHIGLVWVFYAEVHPEISWPASGEVLECVPCLGPMPTYDGTNAHLDNPSEVVRCAGFQFEDSCRYVVIEGFEITDIGNNISAVNIKKTKA